ncbi:MAG: hypothetical protein HPY71_01620 [Firmicutes bacterium]|nr:hypothetical protein [Bacillota bacterium]
MKKVRQERSGWRDKALSERHKLWGYDCPAIDIDFLLIEYDHGRASAIVEYKHEKARLRNWSLASYLAMIDLGDRAGVPVFVCRYAGDFSWWQVIPLNGKAREYLRKETMMTEGEWVSFLYELRGSAVPEGVLENIELVIRRGA